MAAYRYYKLNCTDGNSAYAFLINEIELFETIEPVYGGDVTTSAMTVTDNQNYGAGYEGSNAFNNTYLTNGSGYIWQKNGQTYPIWVKVDLGAGNAKEILSYMIMADNGTYAPKDWTLQGSNNDADWTTVSTIAAQTGWSSGERRAFKIDYVFTLSGTVKDYSSSGIARSVRVIRKSDGGLVGTTTSASGTGIWSIATPTAGPYQVIEFKSDTDDEEAQIYDAVTAI